MRRIEDFRTHSHNKYRFDAALKLLPVVLAVLVSVAAVVLSSGSAYDADITADSVSDETAAECVSKEKNTLDDKPDSELAIEFASEADAVYLSCFYVCEVYERADIFDQSCPESESASETDTETETLPETESDKTGVSEDKDEAGQDDDEYDFRQSVWSHYPNLGVVTAPNYLHIRTQPNLDAEIVGVLFNMSGVDLLDTSQDGQWYHIISNGIEGYINAEFVVTGDEAKTLAYENAFPAVTVTTEVLNVRQQPSTDSAILTQIISGSLYEVIDETNDEWLKIKISSEIEGYVSRDFVNYDYALQDAVGYSESASEEEVSINPVRLALVQNAMQYLGGRYVWGGTELGVGVDCSGFMLRLFEQYGYKLPRTSYWQVDTGTAVSFEDMQPGDLIFYWNNSLGRVGHVAMYIGNNQIIHAASEQRGIVIDDYRFMTPYCARNIIGE